MINGINVTEAILLSPADRRWMAGEAADLGVTHVRVEIPWQVVQPVLLGWPNGYDWAATDDMIKAFSEADLKICAVLGVHRADWQKLDMAWDFGIMCATVASRYAPFVDIWEIWNEQNNAAYWSATSVYGPFNSGPFFNSGPKASEYVPFLQSAHNWIHAVQPNATVLFGGMAANLSYWHPLYGNVSQDPVIFLKDSYKAGAKGYFDGLAYHPYPMDDSFQAEQEPTVTQKFIAKIANLRQVMASEKDAKPIHLTEWGFGQGTDLDKARRIVTQYSVNAIYGDVVSNYLYSLRDWGGSEFGLFRDNWTRRPAYDAYKELIK